MVDDIVFENLELLCLWFWESFGVEFNALYVCFGRIDLLGVFEMGCYWVDVASLYSYLCICC